MRIKYPSIFPSEFGNLVIGPYPHGVKDTARVGNSKFNDFGANIPRQPFLCVEAVGDEFVLRSAGPTFEHCAAHMGPNRWIVWPWDGASMDTSCIYGE